MERLPFLVEHGDTVWQGTAALAALIAIAIARLRHAWRERRSTARELAARSARATGPVEGVATIRGTLRGGRARSVSLLHLRGRAPYYDERDAALWLDCGGQRVVLDGPIRVLRGTRVVSTRNRHSGLPSDEVAVRSSPILHRLTARTESVGDGDLVLVTARLAPRPGGAEHGYREATTAWTATPAGKQADPLWLARWQLAMPPHARPLGCGPEVGRRRQAAETAVRAAPAPSTRGTENEVFAATPIARAVPLGAAYTAATGLAGAALAIAALWGAGRIALAAVDDDPIASGQRVPAALADRDPLALAAATPGNRGAALAMLEARLAERSEQTPAVRAAWRRAAQLRDGCAGEIAARIAQDEIRGLAWLAEHCSDDAAAAGALQYLGRFADAAARDLERPAGERHIESLIATGAWTRAAWWASVQRDAAAARGARGEADGLACLERWFRVQAGELTPDAGRARGTHGPVCAVLAALLAPEKARATALATAAALPGAPSIAGALVWSTGAPSDVAAIVPQTSDALHRAVFDPDDRETIARALLAEATMEQNAITDRAPGVFDLLVWRSIRALLEDRLDVAQRTARALSRGDWPADSRPAADHALALWRHGHALGMAFALRTGRPPAAPLPAIDSAAPDADAQAWRRYGNPFWHDRLRRDACHRPQLGPAGDLVAAVARAEAGDGRALAERLARCRRPGPAAIAAAFAAWPQVRVGLGRLCDALSTIDLGPPARDPLAVLARAAIRRDLARMIGDNLAAGAWQEIIERHLRAFRTQGAVIALIARELVR